jgi:hypothetical protein
MKNGVNVPSKSNKQKKIVLKNLVFAGILMVNDENSRIRIQDPDPLVRGMDPLIQIRIHPKCHGSATLIKSVGMFFKR